MKILRTEVFKEDYKRLPLPVQEKFDKKIKLFIHDIRQPSLRVKKMKGHKNRWEASIDYSRLLLKTPACQRNS